VLGATPVQPTPCAEVTPVVAPGCAPGLSRESRSNPEPWSLLQSGHDARVKDCACRGLDVCCDPLGGCRTAPKPRTHLRCCHAPCEISRRTSGYGSCLSRETGLRPDASACLGRTSFGRCGETVSPSGGAVKTAQMAGAQVVSLSGGRMRTLCRTPTYGPGLSREAR